MKDLTPQEAVVAISILMNEPGYPQTDIWIRYVNFGAKRWGFSASGPRHQYHAMKGRTLRSCVAQLKRERKGGKSK